MYLGVQGGELYTGSSDSRLVLFDMTLGRIPNVVPVGLLQLICNGLLWYSQQPFGEVLHRFIWFQDLLEIAWGCLHLALKSHLAC